MSYLVEQPPYCDLLRLSPATQRFVRFLDEHTSLSTLCFLFFALVAMPEPQTHQVDPKGAQLILIEATDGHLLDAKNLEGTRIGHEELLREWIE